MIIDGSDLMVYVDTSTGNSSTPVWEPTANATSHQITLNAETRERATKDTSGKWKDKSVIGMSVSIKCDALVANDDSIVGFDELRAMCKAGHPVKLKYSKKSTSSGDTYEQGLFIITSIDQTSAANEDAAYSATFENTGEVTTENVSAD